MTPWLFALIFSYSDLSSEAIWRLLLGLGCIPALVVVICSILESRQKLQESSDIHKPLRPSYNADNNVKNSDVSLVKVLQMRETW